MNASPNRKCAGWLSDRTGKGKTFALAGYGFSTLAKVMLLIRSSITGRCHLLARIAEYDLQAALV